MARARNIKPAFFMNEDLIELSFEARLLFIGLWTIADREGYLEDRPKRIKMALFPADSINIDALLNDLASKGFVLRYEVDGNKYIQVCNFGKHQNPNHKESVSTIPKPVKEGTENKEESISPRQALDTPQSNRADSLIPDSLIPDSLNSDSLIVGNQETPSQNTIENSNEEYKPALELVNTKLKLSGLPETNQIELNQILVQFNLKNSHLHQTDNQRLGSLLTWFKIEGQRKPSKTASQPKLDVNAAWANEPKNNAPISFEDQERIRQETLNDPEVYY